MKGGCGESEKGGSSNQRKKFHALVALLSVLSFVGDIPAEVNVDKVDIPVEVNLDTVFDRKKEYGRSL